MLAHLQAERLADMTDLQRQLEGATTRIAQMEEEREAADVQLDEASARIASLTAELAAAEANATMYQEDLDISNVSRGST